MGAACHTISGNPAKIFSPAIMPVESLKLHFSPSQEGSGDPSTENVRPINGRTSIECYKAGRNLFDKSTGIELTERNMLVARNRGDGKGVPFLLKGGTTYTMSCNNTTVPPSEITFRSPYGTDQYAVTWGRYYLTYTPVEDLEVSINFYWIDGRPADATDIQIEIGSEMTPFETYGGATTTIPITFQSIGKNLFNPANVLNAYVGTKIVSGSAYRTAIIPVCPGKTYTISKGSGSRLRIGFTLNTPQIGDDVFGFVSNDTQELTVTAPDGANYMCVYCVYTGEDANTILSTLQVEMGSVATSYVQYDPSTTCYGGYADPADGTLTVEYVMKENAWGNIRIGTPSETSVVQGGYLDFEFPIYYSGSSGIVANSSNTYCNVAKYLWKWTADTTDHFYTAYTDNTYRAVIILDKNTPADTNVMVVAKLITPYKVPLTQQEIKTLKGSTTFWDETNETVDATYEVADSIEMLKAKKRMIANVPHLEQVEPHDFGDILRFNTNMKAPLEIGGAMFVPSQAGSGDASTNNIRKVVGRKDVIVKRTRKNIAKLVGFSANSYLTNENYRSSQYKLTNNYGTTISGICGQSVTVTQSEAPNTELKPGSANGFFCFNFHGLEQSRGGYYILSFDVVNVTNNPLNASFSDFYIYTNGALEQLHPFSVVNIANGARVAFRTRNPQYSSSPERNSFELRICGISATFTNFMITSYDEEDQTYEPYEEHLGKNMFCCTAEDKEQAGGKFVRNLDGTVTCSGTPTEYCTVELGQAFVNSSMGNVRISGLASASNVAWDIIALYDETKTLVADFPEVGGSQSDKTIDLSSYPTVKYLVLAVKRQSNGIGMSGVVKPQVELGTTTTDFEPYCDDSFPIVISAPGKNLYPFRYETYTTTVYSNGYAWAGQPWKITDRTVKYTFSVYFDNTNGDRPCHVTIWMRNADNSDWSDGTARTGNDIAAGSSGYSAISIDFSNGNYPNTYYLCFGGALAGNAIVYRPMVELGSHRTEYEPYNESVYGAYIDWTRGIMAITHQCVEIPFEKEWSEQDIYFAKYQSNAGTPKFSSAIKDFLVSHHKNAVGIAGSVYINSSGHILFGKTFASDLGLSTSAEINTWLKTQHDNGTPLQVCGELVEPIYVQIDPVQIKTLLGYNAIRAGTDEAVGIAYWTH